MIDKLEYLDDGEVRYPLAFTLNVMEAAEEEYGGVESWAKLMDQKEPSYKALKFMVLEIINEGIDIQNRLLAKSNFKADITLKIYIFVQYLCSFLSNDKKNQKTFQNGDSDSSF